MTIFVAGDRDRKGTLVNQTWLVTAFFFALLLAILYVAILILSPFVKAIAWAGILAIIVYPLYARLLKLFRGRRTAAALLLTALITLLIVMPAFRLAGFLSQEAVDLARAVRTMANNHQTSPSADGSPWLDEILGLWHIVSAELEVFGLDLKKATLQGLQSVSTGLVGQVKEIAQDVFLFMINFLIALFTLFFFLRDGKELFQKVGALLPMDRDHQALLFENIVNSLYGVIHGCLITAFIQGLLAGAAYWFLGVPFAVLLGAATSFTALFPIGGSSLVWIPVSIYLFINGTFLQTVIMFVWGAGIVGTVDNVLKPIFIGTRIRLPTLFLFFSILGGLRLFGVLGLIVGPVLFALLAALLDLYMKEYARI